MRSLNPEYLESLRFTSEQAAIMRAVGEYHGKQTLFFHQAPETLKSLRQSAEIESTESSSRIEGITMVQARLEPLIQRRVDPENYSEQEIAGYRDALALIQESGRKMDFSPNVVLQLHGTLYRYMPRRGGRWKGAQNEIIETGQDGSTRIRFTPTAPHLVPEQMGELAERYARAVKAERVDGLILVPLAILDFLCIHPFSDGNGRVARLLTLMLLYQFDYQVGRYISLERIIEDSKETYYESLEASSAGWHDDDHDVLPWLNYFWGVLLRAYREFEQQVKVTHDGHGAKTEQIRVAVLRRKEPFSISEIERECANVSRDMVRHVLRKMRDEDLIESTGRGRAAKWRHIAGESD